MDKYLGLSRMALSASGAGAPAPDLVVWPETSMPFFFQLGGELPARLREFARTRGVWLLFGGPAREGRDEGIPDGGAAEGGDSAGASSLRNRAFLLDPLGVPAGVMTSAIWCRSVNTFLPFSICRCLSRCFRGWAAFRPERKVRFRL